MVRAFLSTILVVSINLIPSIFSAFSSDHDLPSLDMVSEELSMSHSIADKIFLIQTVFQIRDRGLVFNNPRIAHFLASHHPDDLQSKLARLDFLILCSMSDYYQFQDQALLWFGQIFELQSLRRITIEQLVIASVFVPVLNRIYLSSNPDDIEVIKINLLEFNPTVYSAQHEDRSFVRLKDLVTIRRSTQKKLSLVFNLDGYNQDQVRATISMLNQTDLVELLKIVASKISTFSVAHLDGIIDGAQAHQQATMKRYGIVEKDLDLIRRYRSMLHQTIITSLPYPPYLVCPECVVFLPASGLLATPLGQKLAKLIAKIEKSGPNFIQKTLMITRLESLDEMIEEIRTKAVEMKVNLACDNVFD